MEADTTGEEHRQGEEAEDWAEKFLGTDPSGLHNHPHSQQGDEESSERQHAALTRHSPRRAGGGQAGPSNRTSTRP